MTESQRDTDAQKTAKPTPANGADQVGRKERSGTEEALSDGELDAVSGGTAINPQPLPPQRLKI